MPMRSRVGDLSVEITRPESARFRHPLLLLHGLWTGAWIWEGFATYLAHRGWESWAPDLRSATPFADHASVVSALERMTGALSAPPIIIAHDAGLVAAALLAIHLPVPAVVGIAPLTPPADAGPHQSLFSWPRFWWLRRRGMVAHPPSGAAARTFLGSPPAFAVERLVPDSGAIFRALASSNVRMPPAVRCPGLVLSGDADAVSPPAEGARLAARLGWEAQTYARRGHFAMLEKGWEEVADGAHRWVVRTLGAGLLMLLEESEEP